MKSKRAFTLIEILITVAIIGTLAALVAKSYQKIRIDTDYREFLAVMQAADHALKLYVEEVGPTTSNPSWTDVFADGRWNGPTIPGGGGTSSSNGDIIAHNGAILYFDKPDNDSSRSGWILVKTDPDGHARVATWRSSRFGWRYTRSVYDIQSIKDLGR